MNRALRRAFRHVLRSRPCDCCGRLTLDLRSHQATLEGPDGREVETLMCRHCVAEGLSGPEGERRVIERARLRLAPPEGRA